MATLTIIHTNDLHGRLTPPAAARLRELVASRPGAVLLDAGDAVSAGNLGFRPGGEPVLSLMSELGYEAMTLGNRETHPRREIFPRKIDRARFSLLCANIEARGNAPLPVRPSVLVERGGARLAVFGLTVPMFTRRQWSQSLCDYWFSPPIETAERLYPQLRREADLVIALTHLGFRQDLELAARLPELDLIVGGHSHTDLDEPVWVGRVPVLQARAFGFFAGVAELQFSGGVSELVAWRKVALRAPRPAASLVEAG